MFTLKISAMSFEIHFLHTVDEKRRSDAAPLVRCFLQSVQRLIGIRHLNLVPRLSKAVLLCVIRLPGLHTRTETHQFFCNFLCFTLLITNNPQLILR